MINEAEINGSNVNGSASQAVLTGGNVGIVIAPTYVITGAAVTFNADVIIRAPRYFVRGRGVDSYLVASQLTAPSYQISGESGAIGSLSVYNYRLNSTGIALETASLAIEYPAYSLTGLAVKKDTAEAAVKPYAYQFYGQAGAIGRVDLVTYRVTGTGQLTNWIDGNITAPSYSVFAQATNSRTANVTLFAPRYIIGLEGFAKLSIPRYLVRAATAKNSPENTEAWVMNTHTAESTRYTHYPFQHIITVSGKDYGVRADGLYLLDYDTDVLNGVTTPINGTIVTKDTDFSSFQSKRVYYCYLNSDTQTKITPYCDGVTKIAHLSSFGGRKTHLAKGNSARYWQFKIENIRQIEGAEFLPELGIRQRRVK